MQFKTLTLEDKEIIKHYLKQSDFQGCDYTFANLFIWKDSYYEQWAVTDNMLVFRSTDESGQNPVYMYPAGTGDLEKTIEKMRNDAHSLGSKLLIRGFTEKEKKLLDETFPGTFQTECPPDQWDYLYLVKDLETLSGSKYHGKRNHIAQFKKLYPSYEYTEITRENIHLCYDFANKWYQYQVDRKNTDITLDEPIVKNALDYFFPLDLTGGILLVDNNPVAFTIGEPLNSDTYVVHVEKALPYIKGAYPMINQCFVSKGMTGYTYVNREEDDGLEGLRKAKKSYHPVKMVEKCVATER